MRSTTHLKRALAATAFFSAVALAGCSTTLSQPASLEHARATYDTLKAVPEIATLAPGPLFEAGSSLLLLAYRDF